MISPMRDRAAGSRGWPGKGLAYFLQEIAIWLTRTFIVATGIVAIIFLVALAKLVFDPKHGAAHYGQFTVRKGLWVWSSITVGCWVVGVRLVPSVLRHISNRLTPGSSDELEGDARFHPLGESSSSRDR